MYQRQTWHHLFPRSPFPQFSKELWNIKKLPDSWHAAWHQIVGARSPLAAIVMLYKIFGPPEGKETLDPFYDEFQKFLESLRRK